MVQFQMGFSLFSHYKYTSKKEQSDFRQTKTELMILVLYGISENDGHSAFHMFKSFIYIDVVVKFRFFNDLFSLTRAKRVL